MNEGPYLRDMQLSLQKYYSLYFSREGRKFCDCERERDRDRSKETEDGDLNLNMDLEDSVGGGLLY